MEIESGTYRNYVGAKFFENYIQYEPDCSTYLNDEMLKSAFITNIKKQFDARCKDNGKCKLNFDYMDLPDSCLKQVILRSSSAPENKLFLDYKINKKGKHAKNKEWKIDTRKKKAEMFFLSYCESKDIKILKLENLVLSKRTAAYIIVSFDFVVLLVTIFG